MIFDFDKQTKDKSFKVMHREEAWWKKKRLNTSADSWEGLVAEYCGFDWQDEEMEEEEEEELTLREGGFIEAATVKKEVETIAEKNVEDSSWTRQDTNLNDLVFNENKKAAHAKDKKEDKEHASEREKGSKQFKLNKELLNPIPNLVVPPVDGNLDMVSLSSSVKAKADSFICYKCKKSLKSARQLQTHQAFQHGGVEEEQIKCMVMKCGKMFRKTSTLDNHMRGHKETPQNFSPNLFGPVLLQKKPNLAGLRFPLQQIQNQNSQTQVNRNHQDQNQKKSVISHHLPSSHQIAHQPWKNPVHFKQQETRRVAPKRLISADIDIFGSDHQYQPKLRKASLASTKVVAKKEPPSYNSNMSAQMHNNVFERRSSVTKQQDMKVEMDIDASRGLRF